MKKTVSLIALLTLFVSAVAMAQTDELPISPETKKILYTGVEKTTEALTKSNIFDRALSWAQNNKYRVTTMDKENGLLVCEGLIPVIYPGPRAGMNDNGMVKFTATISGKDGRYKYEMTNFKHEGGKGKGNGGPLENKSAECGKFVLPDGGWAKIKKDTAAKMKLVVEDLKASISPQGAAPAKEDW